MTEGSEAITKTKAPEATQPKGIGDRGVSKSIALNHSEAPEATQPKGIGDCAGLLPRS